MDAKVLECPKRLLHIFEKDHNGIHTSVPFVLKHGERLVIRGPFQQFAGINIHRGGYMQTDEFIYGISGLLTCATVTTCLGPREFPTLAKLDHAGGHLHINV